MLQILIILSTFVCFTALEYGGALFVGSYITSSVYEFFLVLLPCLFIWLTFYQTWKLEKLSRIVRLLIAIIILVVLSLWFPNFFSILFFPLQLYSPFYFVYAIMITAIVAMYFREESGLRDSEYGRVSLMIFASGFTAVLFFILSALCVVVLGWASSQSGVTQVFATISFIESALGILCGGFLLVIFSYLRKVGVERNRKNDILLIVVALILMIIIGGAFWGIPQKFII